MIDTLRRKLSRIEDGNFAPSPPVAAFCDGRKRYGVLTLHRPSNVDTREALTPVWGALSEVARRHGTCSSCKEILFHGGEPTDGRTDGTSGNRILAIRGHRVMREKWGCCEAVDLVAYA